MNSQESAVKIDYRSEPQQRDPARLKLSSLGVAHFLWDSWGQVGVFDARSAFRFNAPPNWGSDRGVLESGCFCPSGLCHSTAGPSNLIPDAIFRSVFLTPVSPSPPPLPSHPFLSDLFGKRAVRTPNGTATASN